MIGTASSYSLILLLLLVVLWKDVELGYTKLSNDMRQGPKTSKKKKKKIATSYCEPWTFDFFFFPLSSCVLLTLTLLFFSFIRIFTLVSQGPACIHPWVCVWVWKVFFTWWWISKNLHSLAQREKQSSHQTKHTKHWEIYKGIFFLSIEKLHRIYSSIYDIRRTFSLRFLFLSFIQK